MSVYMIVEVMEITDQASYMKYIRKAMPVVKSYGGEYLVRGGKAVPMGGYWEPGRIVVIRFPSMQDCKSCFESDEYQEIAPLRYEASTSRAVVVDEYKEHLAHAASA